MITKLPSIDDVNLSCFRSWIYNRLTKQAVDDIYYDELADALGIPYDVSVSESSADATEEEWIEYNNFYDEQNDNIRDLYYAAIDKLLQCGEDKRLSHWPHKP